jgi:RNA polymerase sigma factor (sigma-70 family)
MGVVEDDMKDRDVREFIRSERHRLVSYVASLLAGPIRVDAEDLVHDVLISILERSDRLAPEYLAAYVYRSLRNRVIDHARVRKPTVSLDATEGDGSLLELLRSLEPNPMEVLQTSQGRQQLFTALETLSDMERNVVIAHEFEGTPFKELSIRLNVPQNTLLSHKSRAVRKLKQYFSQGEGEK